MNRRTHVKPPSDPLWYRDAVIYQLHVKSFFDANNDGVGDFAGLIQKLDYIAEIGVTAIWLLPFYPSPRRDDGYDISEYRAVHPEYGSMGDVRRFIEEAHRRGLRVITELVINHSSDQHRWFQRARKAKPGSAARNYYVWSDDDKKYGGTRIIFCDTEKSNWTWDEEAKAYFWHRFYSHQPDLNFDNPLVLKWVLSFMRFWLDLGVDGLRLDAVPYLIEREGTSNENLPETHELLKLIRREVDKYPDRMLLAEANQWPEDTQAYFGDGDECHMAFHFPLMPRMYMAIAQEDRFPITDILRQTPDVPSNCQWAIFLRNHDELTLEMVTDAERDYLWEVYASDRRARLNLGIRRRLAPLLERDRRRIELMKSLLLTMPGTPIVYYGDEIGMGDNLHLGDRDGVRTPMQWSSDRNGGFSRADPAALVLPSIMDPIYGYEALNVEAQWRDPYSLLNWFRRMLVERRKHRAFGRGSLRLLHPMNRKVLAYLREYEDEVILCVANVSRSAQAVELDLAEFAGRTPVELSGGTPFPKIGQLTYLLTLPPHGFYWFTLSVEALPPPWSTSTSGPAIEHRTFVLRGELIELSAAPQTSLLASEILPPYIRERRWFQGKDRKITNIEILAQGSWPKTADMLYNEISVRSGERADNYNLILSIAWEGSKLHPFEVPLAMARVRRGRRVGLLTDAFASPALAHSLVEGMQTNAREQIGETEIVFHSTRALEGIKLAAEDEIEWPGAEQSNSTLIIGRKAVVKLYRRLTAGIHPEAEMCRVLTERGFSGTPPLLGEVVRVRGDNRSTIAVAHGFVANQGDGWRWSVEQADRIVDHGATPHGAEVTPLTDAYAEFARVLGRRVAEMHQILAQPTDDDAFAPERIDAATARRQAEAAMRQVERSLDDLEAAELTTLEDAPRLARLKALRPPLLRTVGELADAIKGQIATRIHGDLHLGQILVANGDAIIIDFEGAPLKTIDERREKQSPLRDLASMLRSFDYVAASARRMSRQAEGSEGQPKADALLLAFCDIAERAFLEGYAERIGRPLNATEERLLRLYQMDQAAYEISYEIANRPGWVSVPLRGLADLADQLIATEVAHA